MTPVTSPFEWLRAASPSRFAHLVETRDPTGCRVAILGFPDDTGVRLNGGRPGAAEGPRAFREALSRYGAAYPAEGGEWPRVFDAGDVSPVKDPDPVRALEETHARVEKAARTLLEQGMIPVGIGGGHDLTFPFVRALVDRSAEPPEGIYLDAHLDVRAEPGSGMPFRALVERAGVRALHLRGMDPYVNRPDHLNWFREHGGRTEGFGPGDPWPEAPLFVSVDLDVLDQAYAPGVSAMNPRGWQPAEVAAWVRAAGANPRVGCLDLMELSPPHDEGRRTARLAAHLFLTFLDGVRERP